MHHRLHWILLLLAIVVSCLLHGPHFRKDVMGMHSWRQTQTQTTAISFLEEGGSILQPKRNDRGAGSGVFRQEFPLYQWLMAKAYSLLGENPLVMRGVSLTLSWITILGLYCWLFLLSGNKAAAGITVWAFTFSPTFFYHGFNPMPDNLALCFGVWSLAVFHAALKHRKLIWWFLLSLLLAGATLVKLPFVLYYTVPAGWLLWSWRSLGWQVGFVRIAMLGIGLSLPAAWYFTVIPEWQGNNIVGGVLSVNYGWSRLFDYFQHNLISTLPELLLNFAAVPIFLFGLYAAVRNRKKMLRSYGYYGFLGLVLLIFFFYELHALGKAHDYYLYPYLPVIFLVVCYGSIQWWGNPKRTVVRYALPGLLLLAPVFCGLRLQKAWNPDNPGYNPDLYAYREALRGAVSDDALVVVGVDQSPFIYLYYLRKKGWVLNDHNPDEGDLRGMISAGAEFLYLDSEQVLAAPWISKYLGELVIEKGRFKVFRVGLPQLPQ